MTAATLTTDILESLRQRRASGTSLKALAVELGLPWQKLEKALRHGIKSAVTVDARGRHAQ